MTYLGLYLYLDNGEIQGIKVPNKNLSVLHFLLQEVQLCMDLDYIQKILPLPWLEKIPSAPVYIAGMMNLKNKCIPVIDLAISIGLNCDKVYPLNIPILLCSDGSQQIGLIVDKVHGLGTIDQQKIEKQDEFAKAKSPYFGALTLETGVSLLINTDWLFSLKLAQESNHE